MLEKSVTIGQIEVLELGQIQVRTDTKIIEDGIEISKSYHRHVLCPADSLVDEDAKVIAIANAVWTPEVISAYKASIETK